ncbi:hypothetical protein NDU88_001018 [Pleurodeles waltl]|uniref:Uncharacterized protein n=1 Tax=Pleurodeles waltl TaxID=8319 RepID=A0AAV7S6V7_PLEWA|nr:hypothetical protein NDU88_001018 [Pleurodeles waltl]
MPVSEATPTPALHPSPPIVDSVEASGNLTDLSSMEGMLSHTLEELRAMKVSQKEAHRKTNEQLSQLNANLIHLSIWVSQAEQRISDLEDVQNRQESVTSQIQTELQELQFKLDEVENRPQHYNLRFIGVPEEIEGSSTVTKVISDLIYKCGQC